jgi:HK97 gp10 family phage protein
MADNSFKLNPLAAAHIERIANHAHEKVKRDIVEDAKRYAPVRTGHLRESIHQGQNDEHIEVGAEYGVYQEMGTRHMPAHPFMRPALYQKRELEGPRDAL